MRGNNALFSQRDSRRMNKGAAVLWKLVLPKSAFAGARPRSITYNREKGGLGRLSSKNSAILGVLMAGSSRTTFAKRQKERQRQEKQAEKAQRKLQRKAQDQEQDPNAPEKPKDLTVTYNEEGIPEGFGFHDF